MATDNVTPDAPDSTMPSGIVAVCLFHLGMGALVILSGFLLLISSLIGGIFTVFLGLILLALGYGLMKFRIREWRLTIIFHGIDVLVSLLWLDGVKQVSAVIISVGIIIYLYSRRDLYLTSS